MLGLIPVADILRFFIFFELVFCKRSPIDSGHACEVGAIHPDSPELEPELVWDTERR